MKKLLALIMAAMMLGSFAVGCSSGGEDTPPADDVVADVGGTDDTGGDADADADAEAEPANKLEAILAEGKIVMATSPDYAPYEFVDISQTGQDQYVGSDIELGKYIAEQLGVELEIKAMDYSTVLASVTSGTVDMGIAGLAYKEDRAEAMQLVGPYNLADNGSYQGALIQKDSGIDTFEDLAGKVIGAQLGSLQYSYAETYGGDTAEIKPVSDLALGVLELSEGKIDVLIIASTTGESYAANYDNIEMSDIRFPNTEGTYVGVTNGEEELAAEIQKIVDEAESSGKYAEWFDDAKVLADSLGIDN